MVEDHQISVSGDTLHGLPQGQDDTGLARLLEQVLNQDSNLSPCSPILDLPRSRAYNP